MFNAEGIKESITLGNGKSMMATLVGSLKRLVIQLDGSGLDITLHEVNFVPKLWVDLFSINKDLKNGYLLRNQCLLNLLSKGSVSVTFHRVMRTINGSISGIKLSVNDLPVVCNTLIGPFYGKKNGITEFHVGTLRFR
jgi:hypothetical protein